MRASIDSSFNLERYSSITLPPALNVDSDATIMRSDTETGSRGRGRDSKSLGTFPYVWLWNLRVLNAAFIYSLTGRVWGDWWVVFG